MPFKSVDIFVLCYLLDCRSFFSVDCCRRFQKVCEIAIAFQLFQTNAPTVLCCRILYCSVNRYSLKKWQRLLWTINPSCLKKEKDFTFLIQKWILRQIQIHNKLKGHEATLVWNYNRPIYRVTRVKCRATSVAKNKYSYRYLCLVQYMYLYYVAEE